MFYFHLYNVRVIITVNRVYRVRRTVKQRSGVYPRRSSVCLSHNAIKLMINWQCPDAASVRFGADTYFFLSIVIVVAVVEADVLRV